MFCLKFGFGYHAIIGLKVENHVIYRALPRTILLLMLVTARHGVWIVEQPGSSVLEYYPAWLYFLHRLYQFYGMDTIGSSGLA